MFTIGRSIRALLCTASLPLLLAASAAGGRQAPDTRAADKPPSDARSTEPVVVSPARQEAVAGETTSLTAVRRVWGMPDFQQARRAAQKGQYREAARILVKLRNNPTLTSQERAFCKQQERICQAHLNPAPPRPVPPAPASAPPAVDCGPRSLLLACQALHVPATLAALTKAANMTREGASFSGLKRAAESVGLKAEGVQASRKALPDVATPALAWVHGDHFIAVLSFQGRGEEGTVVVYDPNEPAKKQIAQERLLQMSGGYLLTLHR